MRCIASALLGFCLLGQAWAETNTTFLDRQLSQAQKAVEVRPEDARSFLTLAGAYLDLAEARGDSAYYAKAEEAIAAAAKLGGASLLKRKREIELLLAKRQFYQALRAAQALNRRVPDDIEVYGYLVDAQMHLGELDKAEESAQWMLDLRPENSLGRVRAARLREAFGDIPGAIEMMSTTPGAFDWSEPMTRARSLAYLGHLFRRSGNPQQARKLLELSLETLPGYPVAVRALASMEK